MTSDRKNIYECADGHITVTIELDNGWTPRMIKCTQCNRSARNHWYNLSPEELLLQPTHAWYRPENLDGLSEGDKERIRQNGLLLRKISK